MLNVLWCLGGWGLAHIAKTNKFEESREILCRTLVQIYRYGTYIIYHRSVLYIYMYHTCIYVYIHMLRLLSILIEKAINFAVYSGPSNESRAYFGGISSFNGM